MLSGVWAGVRREADALGVPERGVQLVTRLRSRLDAVASRAAAQPARPRVACLVGLAPPRVPGGWIADLVAWAGGELVPGAAGRALREVRPDEPGIADAGIIVIAPAGLDLAAAHEAAGRLVATPGWDGLPALREGRLYVADGATCAEQPGPQVAEALEAMAEMLHPGAFRFGHEGRIWARLDRTAGT